MSTITLDKNKINVGTGTVIEAYHQDYEIAKKTVTIRLPIVTFDANGHGTAPAAIQTTSFAQKISAPTAPTAEGFVFNNWYREAACTTAWNFGTDTVTDDTTLYANWLEGSAITHEHDNVTFQPWGDNEGEKTSLPTSGSYYLTDNVTVSATTTVSGTLNLCLNGFVIKSTGTNVYTVPTGTTLSIYDCDTEMTHKGTLSEKVDATGDYYFWTWDENATGANVKVIKGGIITGVSGTNAHAINVNGGTLNLCGGSTNNNGSGVYLGSGTFNMKGGTVAYCKAFGNQSGSIHIVGGTFNLSGGTIQYCKADKQGGGLSSTGGTVNISGGVIEKCYESSGGGAALVGANVTISGGEIRYNTANSYGGGIMLMAYNGTSDWAGAKGLTLAGTAQIKENYLGGTLGDDGLYSGGRANNI